MCNGLEDDDDDDDGDDKWKYIYSYNRQHEKVQAEDIHSYISLKG